MKGDGGDFQGAGWLHPSSGVISIVRPREGPQAIMAQGLSLLKCSEWVIFSGIPAH